MRKKFLFILILCYLSLIYVSIYTAEIHVPADFLDIQEAIDNSISGDEVIVASGIYEYANTIVMKDGVDLIGAGAEITTISSSIGVIEGANDCKILGFTVRGYHSIIKCTAVDSFEISDNILELLWEADKESPSYNNGSVIGINLANCSSTSIVNNTIDFLQENGNFGYGIYINDSSEISVFKNRIINKIHWYKVHGITATGVQIKIFNNLVCYIGELTEDYLEPGYLYGNFYGILTNNTDGNIIANNVVNIDVFNVDFDFGSEPPMDFDYDIAGIIGGFKVSNNIVLLNLPDEPILRGGYGILGSGEISYNNVYGTNIEYLYSDYDYWEILVHQIWQVSGEPVSGPGNLNTDPMFVCGAEVLNSSYYMLQPGSPCIDTGDPDPAYNDLDGTRNDMGIFGGANQFENIQPSVDLCVLKYSTTARPGFDMEYTIMCYNRGDAIAENVNLLDILPSEVIYLSSNPSQTFRLGRFVLWDLGDIDPHELKIIKINVKVSVDILLGSILQNIVLISTSSHEEEINNNIYSHEITVTGSYDPNDKNVSPQGFIKGYERLFYVINYENKGTAEAVFIKIEDNLSPYLDCTSIENISNNGVYNPETSTITWEFDDINLEPGETGFVYFTIKPKEGLAPDTEIRNKASIIFDYNEPIYTPETVTIIATEEQLDLQISIQKVIMKIVDLQKEMIEQEMPDVEIFLKIINEAVEAGVQEIYKSDLPWESLNRCQSKLNELIILIEEQSGVLIPEELGNNLIAKIEDEILPALIKIYPNNPIANAGHDLQIEATGALTEITLDGSSSYDPDPDDIIESYTWYDQNGNMIATGKNPTINLALGAHQFILIVNDGEFDSDIIDNCTENDSIVEIILRDTSPPKLEVKLFPKVLWPPNNKMINIKALVKINDNCDQNPKIVLTSIEINKEGNIDNDVRGAEFGTENYSFFLRASKNRRGKRRVYKITYTATDSSNNVSNASSYVIVPRNVIR